MAFLNVSFGRKEVPAAPVVAQAAPSIAAPVPGLKVRSTVRAAARRIVASASNPAGPPRQVNPGGANYFEALRDSPDRSRVQLFHYGVRSLLRGMNRQTLAALGAYLYDNNGSVSYAVDTIANYSVPIMPMAASPDEGRNRAYDAYWKDWCKVADFSGRFHFDTLQRIACKALDTDGDTAFLPTSENGFPQVMQIEGWRIGSKLNADEYTLDGVRVDRKGRVGGYILTDYMDMPDRRKDEFIPAAQMFLIYDPDRFCSYRGLSPLRRGGNDIRDVADIKAFAKMGEKIRSALAATLENNGPLEENVWDNTDGSADGATPGNATAVDDEEATAQEKKLTIAELLGGDIPILEPGQKLSFLNNPGSSALTNEFMLFLMGCFVQGTGLPPAFFLDEKLTGPNQRAVNGKAQRKFDQRQAQFGRFIEWMWPRVIGWGIENDGLPAGEGFDVMEWQGPAKLSIDAGREMAQAREHVRFGTMTTQEHFGNRQLNWKRETDQSFAEDRHIIDQCKRQAEETGVDVGIILARRGFESKLAVEPEDGEDVKKAKSGKPEPKAADAPLTINLNVAAEARAARKQVRMTRTGDNETSFEVVEEP